MVQLPLLAMTEERARELVGLYGLAARPIQRRRYCQGACCRGKRARGHGPYWYLNRRYIGSDEALQRMTPEIEAGRKYFVAHVREYVGAQKGARRVCKTRRAGGAARCITTEHRTA